MKRTAAVLLMIVGLSGCASDPGFNDRLKAALTQTSQMGFGYATAPPAPANTQWVKDLERQEQRERELEYQRQQAEALRKISNGY